MWTLARPSFPIIGFCALGLMIVVPFAVSLSGTADAADVLAETEESLMVVYETERLFLSCSVVPGEGGASVLKLDNNTGRILPAGWAVFYQQAYSGEGARSTLRLDTRLQEAGETIAAFGEGEALSQGNCSAWTFFPKEGAEPLDPETLASGTFAR